MSVAFAPDIENLLGPAPHDAGSSRPVADAPLPSAAGRDLAFVGGAYEGARRFDKSLALWQPGLGSADLDTILDKPMLDARVRDVIRNDAYVAGGQAIHKDNIVGSMFMLNAKPASKVLGFDDKWEEEFQEEVETLFTLWAESPHNWMDASRMNTLTSFVRLGVGVYCMAGELLATAEWMRDGRPFNTALQMIDVDRLSTPMGTWNNEFMRDGVEKDTNGAPVAYNIRTRHPADFGMFSTIPTWTRVPTRKPWGRLQVIHIVEQMRPDQTRGIAAMVSALKEIKITKKFRDTVLQNAVMQATYAATIESDLPTDSVFTQLGGGNLEEAAFAESIGNYAAGFLSQIEAYSGGAKNMALDGLKVPHLFPGTKLQLRPASSSAGDLGKNFEQSLLRYIASALNVSYEQLSKDYSQTNYSSVRAAMTETWKYMQSRKKIVADRTATSIYRLWLEEAISKNALSTLPASKAPMFYDNGALNLKFDAVSLCDWIGAGRGQIDELKETQAAIQRILFGLSTWEVELGRFGQDWRKVFKQIQREQSDRNTLGILQNIQTDMANATTGDTRNKEPGQGAVTTGAGGGGKK